MKEEEIQEAITAHSHWKYTLRQAIKTGKSYIPVEDVKNSHLCDLGKWLDSPTGKGIPNRAEILQMHQAFHDEAAHILALALDGKKEEAEAKLQLGSNFGQLTAQLVNKLAKL